VFALALKQGLATPSSLRGLLEPSLRSLRLFAIVFPFGRARVRWILGLLDHAMGRHRAARRNLAAAITLARRHRMPFEELRAVELLLPLSAGPQATELLARAGELTARVGGAELPTPVSPPEVAEVH
jgi:hypothetical protein